MHLQIKGQNHLRNHQNLGRILLKKTKEIKDRYKDNIKYILCI